MMNSQYMENKYDVPNHQPEMDFPSKKNKKILQKQQNPIFLKVPPKKKQENPSETSRFPGINGLWRPVVAGELRNDHFVGSAGGGHF